MKLQRFLLHFGISVYCDNKNEKPNEFQSFQTSQFVRGMTLTGNIFDIKN